MATIKLILKWVYGIALMLSGISVMFSLSVLGGFFLIVSGLFLLPPTLSLLETEIGNKLSRPFKYGIVFLGFTLGIVFTANNQVDKETDSYKTEQEEFEKLPQHVKDSVLLIRAQRDSLEVLRKDAIRKEEELKNRKEKVELQFSSWDGSHPGLTALIKKNMNDPDSYEHIETRFRDEGNSIFVITQFRGKNAFGGKVVNTVTARVDFDGNVIEVLSQQ